MATLAVQQITTAGLAPTFTAASVGGDAIACDNDNSLRVKNGSGGSITVTIASPTPCNFGFVHNVAVAVAAGADVTIGPLILSRFGDATGLAQITYSAVTSITVAAISG